MNFHRLSRTCSASQVIILDKEICENLCNLRIEF